MFHNELAEKVHMSFRLLCILSFLFVSGCSLNESKLTTLVDREVGRNLIVEKARLELDKQLGRNDCKLKSSLLEMVADKIHIQYNDFIIDGRRARVRVNAEVPNLKGLGALFAQARNIPRERLLGMSADELLAELGKHSRGPASEIEFKTEVYEFTVDFEKDKEWAANSDQLKKAYSKKNLLQ